jgi:cytochrome c553
MKKLAFAILVMLGAVSTASAAGDAAAGKSKSMTCAACHGADGNSMVPTFPKLAGQHASYIEKQLHNFKAQERKDPTMNGMAAPLSDQDIADLAAYFSSHTVSIGAPTDVEKAKLGKKLFEGGDKKRGISACMACHGPTGSGNPGAKFPSLKGQHPAYIIKALKDFRTGTRANDPAKMMRDIAAKMSDKDIENVAQYISGLH